MCFNAAEEHYKSNPITDTVPSGDAPCPPPPAAFLPRTAQPRARCQSLPKAHCDQRVHKAQGREGKDREPKRILRLFELKVLRKGRDRSALHVLKPVMFLPT